MLKAKLQRLLISAQAEVFSISHAGKETKISLKNPSSSLTRKRFLLPFQTLSKPAHPWVDEYWESRLQEFDVKDDAMAQGL